MSGVSGGGDFYRAEAAPDPDDPLISRQYDLRDIEESLDARDGGWQVRTISLNHQNDDRLFHLKTIAFCPPIALTCR